MACCGKEKMQIESFDDMELEENILRGIYSYGFERHEAEQRSAHHHLEAF